MCGSLFEELLRTSRSRDGGGRAGEEAGSRIESGCEPDPAPIEPALLQRFGRACLMAATAAQLTRRITGIDEVAEHQRAEPPLPGRYGGRSSS